MSIEVKTDEEYYNLLGMFGVALAHLGGKLEVPQNELLEIDLTTKEFKEWYDNARGVFVFELVDVETNE